MHPDVARQLAGERHADFLRESAAHAAPQRPRPSRRWLRRAVPGRYAGTPAGARTGT